jgi:hypothetical protein
VADLQQIVTNVLTRYLAGTDPRENGLRSLAAKHQALPVLMDWAGFIGLRADGRLLWITEDADRREPDLCETHLALVYAGERFPELGFLRPKRTADWVECTSCGGTRVVLIDGNPAPANMSCQCAGLGWLPPDVAAGRPDLKLAPTSRRGLITSLRRRRGSTDTAGTCVP